jgi:hypothetical protein
MLECMSQRPHAHVQITFSPMPWCFETMKDMLNMEVEM